MVGNNARVDQDPTLQARNTFGSGHKYPGTQWARYAAGRGGLSGSWGATFSVLWDNADSQFRLHHRDTQRAVAALQAAPLKV